MNFLQDNKAELLRRQEWIATQTNDYQLIKAYMSARMGDITLTDDQEKKLKRWQFIYDQLSTGKYTKQEVRLQVLKHFGISETTSYQDISQAQELMATTLNINKKFKILIDIDLLDLMKLKAKETNQLEAYAKLQKVQNELYKMLPDEEDVPGDYFTPRENTIQFNPALLGTAPIPDAQLKRLLEQLKTEFNIQDVDYTLVEPNEPSTSTL